MWALIVQQTTITSFTLQVNTMVAKIVISQNDFVASIRITDW